MKVQKLYEMALAYLGKTEEGTDYPFLRRVPMLLNPDIEVLNAFRDEDDQLEDVTAITDTLDLSNKEAQGLALGLAVIAGTEANINSNQLSLLVSMRNRTMGSICTEMEEIEETIGQS